MGGASRRHALVTGGGKGIGLAVAAALSAAGIEVSVTGRDRAALDAAVGSRQASHALIADVTDIGSMQEAVAQAERHAPIDILVNNAGGVETGPFLRLDDAAFERQLTLNLMSTVRMTRFVLPGMTQRGFGRIVNIGSTAGLKGYPYVTAYVTAKHAVIGFTRALALEVAKTGITVNALCPGYTDTDLVRASVETVRRKTGGSAEAVLEKLTSANPQARLVRPQEVAAAAVWLVSDAAAAVTGQAIAIDGGETVA
ncbi:Short-chain dehydrogenase [Rhizobiales bacterium GAS191]|nr:Short-chain dehydrogenase [Rhizobiales bacterium GAS191]SEE63225.1 Short-chain dehydrogenase [Rhizobiales bacterium GAS188]